MIYLSKKLPINYIEIQHIIVGSYPGISVLFYYRDNNITKLKKMSSTQIKTTLNKFAKEVG